MNWKNKKIKNTVLKKFVGIFEKNTQILKKFRGNSEFFSLSLRNFDQFKQSVSLIDSTN